MVLSSVMAGEGAVAPMRACCVWGFNRPYSGLATPPVSTGKNDAASWRLLVWPHAPGCQPTAQGPWDQDQDMRFWFQARSEHSGI